MPATRDFLSTNAYTNWPTIGGPFGDCGWILHVDEDARANLGNRRFKGLWRIFAYAAERGYDLVLFDFVEAPTRDLPVYH